MFDAMLKSDSKSKTKSIYRSIQRHPMPLQIVYLSEMRNASALHNQIHNTQETLTKNESLSPR